MKLNANCMVGILLCSLLVANAQSGEPIPDTITYQARLIEAGVPATGVFHFRFQLYDAASGGDEIGDPIVRDESDPVTVSAGLFGVHLELSPEAMDGERRWLQVEYKAQGSSTWLSFGVRQEITPAPQALYSVKAGTAAHADQADTATTADTAAEAELADEWSGATVTSASTARTTLGLQALATKSTINNGDWSGTSLSLDNGGTGATSASGARANLGLGALSLLSYINNNHWFGDSLSVENGGTGATTPEDARVNLELGDLATVNTINNELWSGTALSLGNGGTGSTSASGARSNLGLGSLATASNINNANWSGTALAIGNGGTGATSASAARTNLELGPLATASTVPIANGGTGATSAASARTNLGLGAVAMVSTVPIANGGTGATTDAAARTNLGLGTLATASNINNANWSGTALALGNGGTGATSAANARTNLGLGSLAQANTINNANWSGTALALGNGGTGSTTASGARTNLGLGTTAEVTFGLAQISNSSEFSQVVLQGTSTGSSTRFASMLVAKSGTSAGPNLSIATNMLWVDGFEMTHSSGTRPGWNLYFDAGDNSEGGNYVALVRTSGSAGSAPSTYAETIRMEDDGTMHLRPTTDSNASTTAPASGSVKIYVQNGILYTYDGDGNHTQQSSHAHPAFYLAGASAAYKNHASTKSTDSEALQGDESKTLPPTSFEDPDISLPWSFHHKNGLIRKGAVVDMAKLVKYVEEKMLEEQGAEAGQIVFEYDLPQSEWVSVEEHENAQVAAKISELLKVMPPVVVPVGPDGELPNDCWEQVPEYIEQEVTETIDESSIDWATKRIVTTSRQETRIAKVPTGQTITQLKEGYFLKGALLYRKATVDDINPEQIEITEPSPWVIDRVVE